MNEVKYYEHLVKKYDKPVFEKKYEKVKFYTANPRLSILVVVSSSELSVWETEHR